MPDYTNGKIYKLYCNTSNDIYYGSTTTLLATRLAKHKSAYKSYTEGKGAYYSSFKLFENINAVVGIVLVENVSVQNKEQLHARERFYIENNECLNKVIPNRTSKQYYQDNINQIKESIKDYYESNKNIILEKQKAYQKIKINCNKCGCESSKGGILKHQKSSKCLSASSITSEIISVSTEQDELNYRLSNLTVE